MAESSTGFTYRAFISYSHRDKAWADWLHKALETYRVPSRLIGTTTTHGVIPRRLNPIFRDRDELASADSLAAKVNEALRQSENLIVICSPASAASRWVNEEVLAYKRLGRGERIFCLIVGGEPDATDLPGREAEECFCPALRYQIDAAGEPTRERTEPIAADLRPGTDTRQNARLRLIAGVLGVGFDALKQRELQRRTRRMTAIAASALIVMAGTSVLAIYAFISRHEAVVAQHQARVAQQAAQRRQKQAEDLVDFMLGNLSDKLRAESRLDVLQDVDSKAMAYFASLPPTDINDTELEQRAKALAGIGNVRVYVGALPGALEAYQASTAIYARLAAAQPANVARQVDWSASIAWLGMINYQQGKLNAAVRRWEYARQVLQPSLKRSPDNAPLLQQLTYLDDDIGHALEAQGQPDHALALFQERLETDKTLLAAKPNDNDDLEDLGDTHTDLARLALMRGDLAAAIAGYSANNLIKTRLSTENTNDNPRREDMATARGMLGRTLALAGDSGSGMQYLQQAVDLSAQLAKFDPKQADYRTDVALYASELARLKRLTGNEQSAASLNEQATGLLEALIKADSSTDKYRRFYADALIERAKQLLTGGGKGNARMAVDSALQILRPMLAKHPQDRDTLLPTMTAMLLLASIASNRQKAQSLQEDALRSMQDIKTDRDDPRLLALQVEALLALNRKANAKPLVKRLWNQGYRDPEFVAMLQRARIDYPANPAFQAKLLASTHADDPNVSPPQGSKAHP